MLDARALPSLSKSFGATIAPIELCLCLEKERMTGLGD